MPWLEPSLSLRWGPYTKRDADEESKIVDSTLKAKTGGLITLRMAVEKIASVYGIENVDSALESIEEEAEKQQQKQLEQAAAEMKLMHDSANEDGAGAAGGSKQKKDARGGSGDASSSDPASE